MTRDYGEGNRTPGFRPLRAATGVGPGAEARKLFNDQARMQGYCLEGSIFDQLFQHPEGHGLSAMQALNGANREQIPIQRITAGKIDLVPQREITHSSWRSSGYVL